MGSSVSHISGYFVLPSAYVLAHDGRGHHEVLWERNNYKVCIELLFLLGVSTRQPLQVDHHLYYQVCGRCWWEERKAGQILLQKHSQQVAYQYSYNSLSLRRLLLGTISTLGDSSSVSFSTLPWLSLLLAWPTGSSTTDSSPMGSRFVVNRSVY